MGFLLARKDGSGSRQDSAGAPGPWPGVRGRLSLLRGGGVRRGATAPEPSRPGMMAPAGSTSSNPEEAMDLQVALLLAALILLASVVSVEFGISAAIIEITLGVI